MIAGVLGGGVALWVISRKEQPGFARLSIGAVLMGAGIGTMHYSGMAAMQPEALLRYDPAWAAVSIFTAVATAPVSLRLRFPFPPAPPSPIPAPLIPAPGMGCALAGADAG